MSAASWAATLVTNEQLTYMATLDELAIAGVIHKVMPETVLTEDQQAFRQMYRSPAVSNWIRNVLPHIVVDGYVPGAETPRDQALTCLQDFLTGKSPDEFDKPPVRLRPEQLGVWELRTADLRLFGVFPRVDTFLWVTSCTKKQAMKNNNDGYLRRQHETLQFIGTLDLEEPKMLYGETKDVITV